MVKYKANSYLIYENAIIPANSEVELSEEQAAYLGDKVTAVEVEKSDSLSEHTVPELKAIAEGLEIDGFDVLKKAELIQAIEEKQKAEA